MLKLSGIIQEVGKAKDLDIVSAMASLSLSDLTTGAVQPLVTGTGGAHIGRKVSSDCSAPTLDKRGGCIKDLENEFSKHLVMKEARDWALEHLYDLYPQKKTKQALAMQMNLSVDAVTAWFMRLRRRIGWNKIVKKYFGGDRAFAIDAARSVFLEREAAEQRIRRPIYDAFLLMEKRAEDILKPPSPAEIEKHIDRIVDEVRPQSSNLKNHALPAVDPRFPNAGESYPSSLGGLAITRVAKRSFEEADKLQSAKRSKKQERFGVTIFACLNSCAQS